MVAPELDSGVLASARLAPSSLKRQWFAATLRKHEKLESVAELTGLNTEAANLAEQAGLICAVG